MKVKKISYLNGQIDDYIKIFSVDGEIVYIAVDSIVSITVQTNGDVKIICVHNERYLLQDVDKEQLEELLEYSNLYADDEEDDHDLCI